MMSEREIERDEREPMYNYRLGRFEFPHEVEARIRLFDDLHEKLRADAERRAREEREMHTCPVCSGAGRVRVVEERTNA